MQLQQSNVIFGAVLIAFIVFVTIRGELPNYFAILRGGGQKANTQETAIGTLPISIDGSSLIVTRPGGADALFNSNPVKDAEDILSADPGIKIQMPH